MIKETFPVASVETDPSLDFERERGVTHISVRPGVAQFSAYCDAPRKSMADIFGLLADQSINLFLIKIHNQCLGFCVAIEDVEAVKVLFEQVHMRYAMARECALVSVVAPAMRDLSGVLWRIVGCLRSRRIEILELADAYNSVSCLVEGQHMDSAAQGLAEAFGVAVATESDPMDPW